MAERNPRFTYVGTRGDLDGGYASAGKAVNVARQVLGGNVRDGVVVGRDTDEAVLAFVFAVGPDVLHGNCVCGKG